MSDSDLKHGSSEDLDRISGQMDELKRVVEENHAKISDKIDASMIELHKLKVSITGDDLGNKGIAQRVSDTEESGAKNKAAIATMKNDLKWWGAIVAFLSGAIALIITNWNKIFG